MSLVLMFFSFSLISILFCILSKVVSNVFKPKYSSIIKFVVLVLYLLVLHYVIS